MLCLPLARNGWRETKQLSMCMLLTGGSFVSGVQCSLAGTRPDTVLVFIDRGASLLTHAAITDDSRFRLMHHAFSHRRPFPARNPFLLSFPLSFCLSLVCVRRLLRGVVSPGAACTLPENSWGSSPESPPFYGSLSRKSRRTTKAATRYVRTLAAEGRSRYVVFLEKMRLASLFHA